MTSASHFEVRIASDTAEGLAVQDRIIELMEQLSYSSKDIFAIRLSVEEAVTNAIKHGNGNDREKKVTIACEIDDTRLRVTVSDEGPGFIPEEVPDPTLPEFIERATGRGLILMRAYLERCEYLGTGNQIVMERTRNSDLPIIEDD
jgi:serine/threonine-protein kinase RsbW